MPERSLADQLDQALDAMFAGRPPSDGPELGSLLAIAENLRGLPRPEFKQHLKSELERKHKMATASQELRQSLKQSVTAHLRIKGAAEAIKFYKKALGAREIMRFEAGGRLAYAEIEIGNSAISLGESAPEYGFQGPEGYGGSPISLHLQVDDVDAFIAHAEAAGARIVSPVKDQFYGERSGSIADPFGYTWGVSTHKETMSTEEMHERFENLPEQDRPRGVTPPRGFRALTPYITVPDAPALIEFAKDVFDAEETFRAIGSAGGIHAEVKIGDTMLMIGGGAPDLSWKGESRLTALHTYVKDVDATYARALKAGATSEGAPQDHEYGERGAGIRDKFGNWWYLATYKGASYVPEGLGTVTPYLHPLRAEAFISFLKRAFGAEEVEKYATPEGVIPHAKVKIGDAFLEMGEAHGPYQPMQTTFFLYVPNVDTSYQRAITAGATSMFEPADQPYGDRLAGVTDAFGNQWFLATPLTSPGT